MFEVKGVSSDRYKFVVGNVFDSDFSAMGPFEVVLCLGLLYHVAKPIDLLERISSVNTDILVVDTGVAHSAGSSLEVRREPLSDPRNSVDYELVLYPTRTAVAAMVGLFGYNVVPLRIAASDYRGMLEYLAGERVAFLCAKESSLASLPDGPGEPLFALVERVFQRGLRLARASLYTCLFLSRVNVKLWWKPTLDLLSHLRPPKPNEISAGKGTARRGQ